MDCSHEDALAMARDRNEYEGYHKFHSEEVQEPYGSFEILWLTEADDYDTGWYWQACYPGRLPDSDPYGPFMSSHDALVDADEWNPLLDEDYA